MQLWVNLTEQVIHDLPRLLDSRAAREVEPCLFPLGFLFCSRPKDNFDRLGVVNIDGVGANSNDGTICFVQSSDVEMERPAGGMVEAVEVSIACYLTCRYDFQEDKTI